MSIHTLLQSRHNFNLLRNEVPIVFATFFAIPKIRFHRVGKVISGVEFTYPPLSRWNISHASSYSCSFSLGANEHTFGSNWCYVYTPEHSVFRDDTWIALYRVADYALSSYCRGRGLSNRDGLTESTRDDLLLLVRRSVRILPKRGM